MAILRPFLVSPAPFLLGKTTVTANIWAWSEQRRALSAPAFFFTMWDSGWISCLCLTHSVFLFVLSLTLFKNKSQFIKLSLEQVCALAKSFAFLKKTNSSPRTGSREQADLYMSTFNMKPSHPLYHYALSPFELNPSFGHLQGLNPDSGCSQTSHFLDSCHPSFCGLQLLFLYPQNSPHFQCMFRIAFSVTLHLGPFHDGIPIPSHYHSHSAPKDLPWIPRSPWLLPCRFQLASPRA